MGHPSSGKREGVRCARMGTLGICARTVSLARPTWRPRRWPRASLGVDHAFASRRLRRRLHPPAPLSGTPCPKPLQVHRGGGRALPAQTRPLPPPEAATRRGRPRVSAPTHGRRGPRSFGSGAPDLSFLVMSATHVLEAYARLGRRNHKSAAACAQPAAIVYCSTRLSFPVH